MPEFFNDWALWEKLVFVLGCGMVVAVLLGCLKLVHAHLRLRKFTAAAERQRQEQVMNRTMSQRTRQSLARRHVDVPFGIRAIESGVEVEGVWISRGNTPEPDSRDGSANTSEFDHSLLMQGSEKMKYQERGRPTSRSSESTVGAARTSFDRASITERPASNQRSSINAFPEAALMRPPRSRFPPSFYAKYGFNPYTLRQSTPAKMLEALDAIHKASASINGEDHVGSSDSSNHSSDSPGDIDPISASAPCLLTGQPPPRPMLQSTSELDLMNSHRVSQVAETGQLTPRGRRSLKSCSVDFAYPAQPLRLAWPAEQQEKHDSQPLQPVQATSASDNCISSSPVSTPKVTALPPAVRRSSMPDVTPFAEFCKRTSHAVPPSSPRSTSRESVLSATVTSDIQSPVDSVASSPIMPASEGGAAALKLPPPPKRTSFEKQMSQVVRGHGTGFEILRPGSLNPPMPKEHPMERQRATPPVALQNFSRSRSKSEDGRNKLQKKRRPSMESTTTSSTVSRQSRLSLFAGKQRRMSLFV